MFVELLEQVATSGQIRTNLITDGQRTVAYGELRSLLGGIGDHLAAQGIGAQHSIALECANTLPSALTILALMERGNNFFLLPQVQESQADLKPVPHFCHFRVAVTPGQPGSGQGWTAQPADFLAIEANANFQPLPAGVEHGPRRVYLRTSGSMGASKIVVHSHDNFVGNAHNCVKKYALEPSDRVVVPIPLAHIYGLAGAFLPAFAAGCSIDLQSNTNHLQYLAREKAFQPNVAFLTPTLCDLLLNGFSTPRAYKVVVTSGQRIGDELFRCFDQQVGGALINMYGSSELGQPPASTQAIRSRPKSRASASPCRPPGCASTRPIPAAASASCSARTPTALRAMWMTLASGCTGLPRMSGFAQATWQKWPKTARYGWWGGRRIASTAAAI